MDNYFVGVFKNDDYDADGNRIYDDVFTFDDRSDAWEEALKWNLKGFWVEFASIENVGYGDYRDDYDYYEEEDYNTYDYAPYEMRKYMSSMGESNRRKNMKLRIDEDNYGYDSDGNEIDESTVEELYRVANNEILAESELAQIGDADIDEDSWEVYNTGTAYGMNLIYNINFDVDSNAIDLEQFITGENILRPIFDTDHATAKLNFVIHVYNGTDIEVELADYSVYDSGDFYNEYDTNKFKSYVNVKALEQLVKDMSQEVVNEIQGTLSNI